MAAYTFYYKNMRYKIAQYYLYDIVFDSLLFPHGDLGNIVYHMLTFPHDYEPYYLIKHTIYLKLYYYSINYKIIKYIYKEFL